MIRESKVQSPGETISQAHSPMTYTVKVPKVRLFETALEVAKWGTEEIEVA